MKKQLKNTIYSLLPLLLSLLIILASVGLFYYIQGYRFDFQSQQVSPTGVLSIDTIPSRSDLFIEEKLYGKTPKSTTLLGGNYDLKIEKEGYHTWQKTISIVEGKSTSVYPWLIATIIEKEEIFSSPKTIDQNHLYQNDTSIFFTLYIDSGSTRGYELWKLTTHSSAWDFTDNPRKILSFDVPIDSENTFDLLPSPDSTIVLFSTTTDSIKERYIIDTTKSSDLDSLTPIALNGFSDYLISWNNSNKSLLLESDTDILSYDIDTEIKYLITRKSPDTLYTFTTDNTGLIYLIEGTLEEELYDYSLSQYLPNGTSQKEIIPNIYFQKSDQYVESYRNGTDEFSLPFKNSKESTKTSGRILSFSVHEDMNGMFIQSEYAGYWYDLDTSKFILVSPYSTKLISISPLSNQFIFQNSNEIGTLTFKVDDGDPCQYVGKRCIWETKVENISNIQWLSTGENIIFNGNEKVYVSDYDGSNIIEIHNTTPIFISTESDPSLIYLSSISEDGNFLIQELTIH